MRVLVLGGGVMGVTTAWYASEAGHEVTLIERQSGAGLETSFANAGDVCPSYAQPWAGPGMRMKALRWSLARESALIWRPSLDAAMWRWLGMWLANCTAERFAANKSRMQRVSRYSLEALRALRAQTGIAYDHLSRGVLTLFRTDKDAAGAEANLRVLRDSGIRHALLDPDGCIAVEPALSAARARFVGGLHFPDDETGDCYKFTAALAALARERGVEFRYGTSIDAILREGDRVAGVKTPAGLLQADAYVAALGSYTPLLLRPLGIALPIYPVKGYSITMPVADERAAPAAAVMDEHYKVAVTRLGTRIRAGGTAEIAGYDLTRPEPRYAILQKVVRDLYADGGDFSRIEKWSGLRPMTPDGPPILGRSPLANLYLNCGQGSQGWTMACGSGRLTADLISGREPGIALDGLTLSRYH